jgi:hypothetical protein
VAFLYGTSAGFDLKKSSSVVGSVTYEPVIAGPPDLQYLYNSLPSFYRDLMGNSHIFSQLWSATSQVLASDLLNLWHNDYSISPEQITTYNQRKWYKFVFYKMLEFDRASFNKIGDLSFSKEGLDKYRVKAVSQGGINLQGDYLSSYVTHEHSFNVEFEFELLSSSGQGGFLVGFIERKSKRLRNSLSFGVTFLDGTTAFGTSVNERRLTICHATPTADISGVTVSRGSTTLSTSNRYKIKGSYDYVSTVATATLIQIKKEIATITVLETGSTPFKNSFDRDGNVVLATDTISIVIDSVPIVANVTSIDGDIVYLDRECVPVNFSTTLKLLRDSEEDAVNLSLSTGTSNGEFSADTFGIFNLDSVPTYKQGSKTYDPLPSGRIQEINLYSWKYFNPLSDVDIVYLPTLQKFPTSALKLLDTIDYELKTKSIAFKALPDSDLYAEFIAFDERTIYKNYGTLLSLSNQSSTEEYKRKVQGLLYSYYKGPTVQSVKVGVNLLLGLPVALVAGEVTVHNKSYAGTLNQIVVGGETYYYSKSASSALSVGDVLERFDPICNSIEFRDYIANPTWIETTALHQLQKYHSFLVRIDQEALETTTLDEVTSFLAAVKPTQKDYDINMYRTEEDEFDIIDSVSVALSLGILDTLLSEYDPRYDEEIAGLYSYLAGSGVLPGTEATSSMDKFSRLDTKNAFWSEPLTPDQEIIPHLFSVNSAERGRSSMEVSASLSDSPANAIIPHYFGTKIEEGSATISGNPSSILDDSGASFSFVGTRPIILDKGQEVYYTTCTKNSSTQLTLVDPIPNGSYDYQILENYAESDLSLVSGSGVLQVAALEDIHVQFVASGSPAFLTSISTRDDQSPIDSIYLQVYSSSNDDLVLPVSRVIDNTTLECICTPHWSASDAEDLIEVFRGTTETYRVLKPKSHIVIKRANRVTGAMIADSPIITLPKASSTYADNEIAPGDTVSITAPSDFIGEYTVSQYSLDGTSHFITIDREAPSTSSITFEIVSQTSVSLDVSRRRKGSAYSTNTLPYERRKTFAPVLSCTDTLVDIPYVNMQSTGYLTEKYVIQVWNTTRSFLNFDIYEIESPQDEITITFSDGSPSIIA